MKIELGKRFHEMQDDLKEYPDVEFIYRPYIRHKYKIENESNEEVSYETDIPAVWGLKYTCGHGQWSSLGSDPKLDIETLEDENWIAFKKLMHDHIAEHNKQCI